jgi:endonuclease/exonuclease/phosphatase family metal-dependent hydrolase
VMFNEIEKFTWSGNEDQPEVYKALLRQKTGKTWYYMTAQEYGQWNSNGKMNAIFSTVPFNYVDRYELIHNYDRSLAEAEITWNGRRITLMTTHLDPYSHSLRLAQAKEVTAFTAAEPENKILTGDMNAWPDQTSIQHFNQYYNDSWTIAASKGTATAFAGNTGETRNGRIDYIFYSKGASNLVVKASQVVDTRDSRGVMPSDHRPVLTTFEVR